MSKRLSRRGFLKAGAALGAAGVTTGLTRSQGQLLDAALASTSGGSLGDIRHVVILMQENRSFDHYFGTMPGVRGFTDTASYQSYAGGPATDPGSVFRQTMTGTSITGTPAPAYQLADGEQSLWPFELTSTPPTVDGQTINDITHDWGPQHGAWNNGRMDRFAVEHLVNDPIAKFQITPSGLVPVPATGTWPTGITTMGYYRRRDRLAFYRALADAFTICDGYHCSVLGPTDPNRLVSMSGSLGAHTGAVGGPVLTTYVQNRAQMLGTLSWKTMPELLTEHRVSWKVYQDPTSTVLFNVLSYFKQYTTPSSLADLENEVNALTPQFPAGFAADVVAGTLPQVSWILPPVQSCEHPAAPPEYGEDLVAQILHTLLLNPSVWAQTVFLVVYDENGGFFDHVAPPTPGPTVFRIQDIPSGPVVNGRARYDGEYVTTTNPTNAADGPPTDWAGVLGPVGLGFRTPAMVISPFSAGGWVNSDTFDHVSTLKLIDSVFLGGSGVLGELPVSPWRYNAVGDLTTALPNLATPTTAVPSLPATSILFPGVAAQAVVNTLTGTFDLGQGYPPPAANSGAYLTPDTDAALRKPTPA